MLMHRICPPFDVISAEIDTVFPRGYISPMTLFRSSRTSALLLSVAMISTSSLIAQDAAAPEKQPAAEAGSAPGAPETEESAHAKGMKMIESFGWTREGKAKIGKHAELEISPGLRLTDAAGASKLLKMYGNIPSGRDAAILASEDLGWWATFVFVAEGYVEDKEKDDIKPDEILESMRANQKADNQNRKAQGLTPYELTGWAVPPFYNEQTKSLEYGLKIANEGAAPGEESVNYSTKILGRRGYMDVTLVCDPADLNFSLNELRAALTKFNYVSGETYAEYRKGDKVAEYGLTALVAGGGLAIAAKTGLLAKLWKPIAAGVIALAAGFKKLFGKKSV